MINNDVDELCLVQSACQNGGRIVEMPGLPRDGAFACQ